MGAVCAAAEGGFAGLRENLSFARGAAFARDNPNASSSVFTCCGDPNTLARFILHYPIRNKETYKLAQSLIIAWEEALRDRVN